MALSKLYIFVEGNDDERFFKNVIRSRCLEHYDDVDIIKYRQWRKEKVDLFLMSIQTLGFDYVFTADMDFAESVNKKKQIVKKVYSNADEEKMVIVIKEIESWYLAGLSDNKARKLKLSAIKNTDDYTKEMFNDLYRGKFKSRIDFMQEILKVWDYDTAQDKNHSFGFYSAKYLDGEE